MMKFHGNIDHAMSKLKSGREAKSAVVAARTTNSSNPINSKSFSTSRLVTTAGAGTIFTQPQFYSPLHTPQNWQMPSKRREVYQWLRYWVENEPKVGAAIDFYSAFPMNGFKLECKNEQVKKYFEHFVERIDLDNWCKQISREYYTLGDVFPMAEIACKLCGGHGLTKDGKPCRHPGGDIARLVILNPDFIDVQTNMLAKKPVITLMPDDVLKRLIYTKKPIEQYNQIPQHVKNAILGNMPIVLSDDCVSHIKYHPSSYGTYGTSIIRRLFKVLTYKDKLMTAQWVVAERLILPIRVIKVGNAERPAGEADISDIQEQLAQTANDPNLTLVTHHAFDYDWIGASGKVLTLSNEFEMINKEVLQGLMLNEALLSGEMAGYQCQTLDTKALTRTGFKFYNDISDEDEIACFNKETGEIEYHKPLARICEDFDGDIVHFQTDRIDIAVTPNHRMLYKKRSDSNDPDTWHVGRADEIIPKMRFRKNAKWNGEQDIPGFIEVSGTAIPLADYLEIGAFYVTEGCVRRESRIHRKTYNKPMSACIYQTVKGKAWNEMLALAERCPLRLAHYTYSSGDQFVFNNSNMAERLSDEFGSGSFSKKLPLWVKNLPTEHLHKFLMDMIKGDGVLRTRNGKDFRYGYTTVSDQLKDDVAEIALKCGYWPKIVKRKRVQNGKKSEIWQVYFSDIDRRSDSICLDSRKHKCITKMPYKGKVFCFTTPTGFFITERNGKITIQGNSAAIGAESLIQRIESWRIELAQWIEKRLFKLVAQMKGFVDEEETKSIGEDKWIYPNIKWNDLNLRDDTQQKQLQLQLYDKQVISMQTLLEKFGMNYNHEVERMRFESVLQQAGAQSGGGAGGGMGGGDMGGGGAMGGAGAPPPGGDMGAPGGGMPPPGGDMGGGMGGAPGGAPPPTMGGTAQKLLTRNKASKAQKPLSEEAAQPATVRLTSLEQAMYKILFPLQIPFAKFSQMPLGPYRVDFAIPDLKLAIECDGDQWHNLPDDKARDAKKDMTLARYGWTTVRYDESSLKDRVPEVQKSLVALINKLWRDKAAKAEQNKDTQAAEKKMAEFNKGMVKCGFVREPDEFERLLNPRRKAMITSSTSVEIDDFLLAEIASGGRIITGAFEMLGNDCFAGDSPCSEKWMIWAGKHIDISAMNAEIDRDLGIETPEEQEQEAEEPNLFENPELLTENTEGIKPDDHSSGTADQGPGYSLD